MGKSSPAPSPPQTQVINPPVQGAGDQGLLGNLNDVINEQTMEMLKSFRQRFGTGGVRDLLPHNPNPMKAVLPPMMSENYYTNPPQLNGGASPNFGAANHPLFGNQQSPLG